MSASLAGIKGSRARRGVNSVVIIAKPRCEMRKTKGAPPKASQSNVPHHTGPSPSWGLYLIADRQTLDSHTSGVLQERKTLAGKVSKPCTLGSEMPELVSSLWAPCA